MNSWTHEAQSQQQFSITFPTGAEKEEAATVERVLRKLGPTAPVLT